MKSIVNNKVIALITIAVSFWHVARIYIRGFMEDQDIGAFIVMSQSFLSGQVFYADFFDPKLPHVLPIYAVSALTASTAGHLLTALLCITATGLLIVLSGKNIWGGLFYISLILLAPGGATGHLSIFANLFISIAYYCFSRYRAQEPKVGLRSSRLGWLIASAAIIGYVVGLRPNYGFALVPIFFWFSWRDRISFRLVLIWLLVCIFSFLTPLFLSWHQSGFSPIDLINIFSAWNSSFYSEYSSLGSGLIESLVTMYSHRIGFLQIGVIALICVCSVFLSAKGSSKKILPFVAAIAAIWLSYYFSHIYNHYILMDLLLISLLVSSVSVSSKALMPFVVLICLWVILIVSPVNGHSRDDSLTLENRRRIIEWIRHNNVTDLVSPTWLTPHWITWTKVPTIGVHPEWSIGLLDRFDFKRLSAAKRFNLTADWDSQCQVWTKNATTIILPEDFFARCNQDGFRLVKEFEDYPLKVWVKR